MFAQKNSLPKIGTIDAQTLVMTAYPADSSVEAVVLIDYGETDFFYDDVKGFFIRTRIRERIKILKESAFERASIAITYHKVPSNDETEVIDDIRGLTYNLVDGKVVAEEISGKAIVREKLSDEFSAYKFNLPNVRKGSVIEYTYERQTPLNYRSAPGTWNFQADIPVAWSEYKITIPNYFYYKMTMGGYLPLALREQEEVNVDFGNTLLDGVGMAYHFAVKDAPAFNKEPFITTAADYLSKIDFELATLQMPGRGVRKFSNTWENVDLTLHKADWYGRQLSRSGFLKPVVDDIAQRIPATDTLGRFRAAYGYIQKNIKWDDYYSRGTSDGLRKVFDNKKGTASEINLLLVLLLRELGYEANPVLLSTRSHGRVYDHLPLLDRFNYSIGHIAAGGKTLYLDATDPYLPMGELPMRCLNGRGRLLNERGEGSFVDIVPASGKTIFEEVKAEIDPEAGEVRGTYRMSLSGYAAQAWRETNATRTPQAITDDIQKKNVEWEIENVQVRNAEELEKSVEINYDFVLPEVGQNADVIYFTPMLAGRVTKNDFQEETRIYPLDFATPQQHAVVLTFKLPAGYAMADAPVRESISLAGNGGRFLFLVNQQDGKLIIQSRLSMLRTNFDAEEYGALKQFYDKIIQKHSQPVVLKKQAKL